MKSKIIAVIVFFNTICINLCADEGMWLLPHIKEQNSQKLKELGFQLLPESIYHPDSISIKDAIVIFGSGCTGEVISNQGLILTNHHCGYDAIQNLSSLTHNYIEDGFWAESFKDEIPAPNVEVTFLIKTEDVTSRIDSVLSDTLNENNRRIAIEKKCAEIEDEYENTDVYTQAQIEYMFDGNRFYLYIYKRFPDVRFVGAPPSSIGKFGADTDNWMWPRHTCDFSLFRVYADSAGNPAPFSESNIPLVPKYSLKISKNGYNEGDFTMILGYPGNTERYISSAELKEVVEVVNDTRIKVRSVRQEILLKEMLKDSLVKLQYASKYARSSNYYKFSVGQNYGIKMQNLIAQKIEEEKAYTKWILRDSLTIQKYGNAISVLSDAVLGRQPYYFALLNLNECLRRGTELFNFAYNAGEQINRFINKEKGADTDENMRKQHEKVARDFYRDFSLNVEKKTAFAMIKLYGERVEEKFYPDFYKTVKTKYKGNIEQFVDETYKKSIFSDSAKYFKFLKKPSMAELQKDPVYKVAVSIRQKNTELNEQFKLYDEKYSLGRRLYMAGFMEMNKNKTLYPDANFTMRMTYGKVKGYKPRDAVEYNYFTTLKGVVEKEDSLNWEFKVPKKLLQLYDSGNYGNYDENGTLKTCFITDNDITGGNSGSPVLNSKGHLIGLAFDGNWEGLTGDLSFNPQLQRCINVDIRYVLFIIDKFAGAERIIKELDFTE